jgi:acyl transferase domain-containing protein
MPKLSGEAFLVAMREKMDAAIRQVAEAINNAPEGYLISGSEEKVRDLFADLRQQAFELGLQMRVDAAEAAFSPSEERHDRQELSE